MSTAKAMVIMLPFWAIAFWQGYQINHKRLEAMKVEAVHRGFATWVSDENGNTTFTWDDYTSRMLETLLKFCEQYQKVYNEVTPKLKMP